MEKFNNRYRIPSARAYWHDYDGGVYFVTICTYNQICWFGNIQNGKMILSEIGEIVKLQWDKTFLLRPDMNLFMGDYVIMPNHFHAIIGIGINKYNTKQYPHPHRNAMHNKIDKDEIHNKTHRDAMHCVSTSINNPDIPKNKFAPQSKNLASIIRGFKIGVTKNTRIFQPDFEWQTRYHDHIIRNHDSYQNIRNYIINNPKNWSDDKYFI